MPGSSTGASSLPQLWRAKDFPRNRKVSGIFCFLGRHSRLFKTFVIPTSSFKFQVTFPQGFRPSPLQQRDKISSPHRDSPGSASRGNPGFPGFFPFFEGTPALLESPFQEGWEPFFQTGSLPFCPWGRREGPFSTAHNCAIIVALFEKILAKKRGAVYHASDCVCKGGKHWLGPPVF